MDDLSDLKPGDEVVVIRKCYPKQMLLTTVDRITPSGQILVKGSDGRYNQNGMMRGRTNYNWTCIDRASDYYRAQILKDRLKNWSLSPYEEIETDDLATLRKVESLLDEAKAMLAKGEDEK